MFGFISLNGNDLVMLSDFCKSDDMIAFLELIRKQNPDKPLCILLDNARIYHARVVAAKAEGQKDLRSILFTFRLILPT